MLAGFLLIGFDLAFGAPVAFIIAYPDFELAAEAGAGCCAAVEGGAYVVAS